MYSDCTMTPVIFDTKHSCYLLTCLCTGEVDEYQHERLSRHGDWDVADDRRHSGAGRSDQISSAGRTTYSDRSTLLLDIPVIDKLILML